jgi:hypothetical protein
VARKNNADSGIFFAENRTKIQPNYLLPVDKGVSCIWHKTPADFFFLIDIGNPVWFYSLIPLIIALNSIGTESFSSPSN